MGKKNLGADHTVVRDTRRDDLSEILGVNEQTVADYDRAGAPREKRGRVVFYNVPEYRAWMNANGKTGKQGRPIEGDSPDLETAKLRKENALAAKYELQVERERGELVPTVEIKQWIGQHVTAAKNKLFGLGAQIVPHLQGRDMAEQQTIIESRVVEILNELASA